MARRLNKKLVVGLTIAVMVLTAGAAVVMVVAMPERDPEIVAERGRALLANGEFEAGMKQILRAANLSKDPKYLVEAGDAYLNEGLAAEAHQLWQQAAIQDPSSEVPLLRMLDLALQAAQLRASRVKQWREVLTEAEAVLALNASDPKGLHARGLAYLKLVGDDPSNAQKGLADLKAAVQAVPTEATYARDLAVQYVRSDQRKEAEAVLANLTKAAPENARAHQFHAMLLAQYGHDEAALAALNRAAALAPKDPEVFVALGRYWVQHEDLDKARAAYRKAISFDPDGYPAYVQLGALYMREKQPAEALKVYDERIARGPLKRSGFKARFNRAAHFDLLERAAVASLSRIEASTKPEAVESALADAERYLAGMVAELGENEFTHSIRGRIAIRRRRDVEAVRELEQAVEGRPGWVPRPVDMTNLAQLYIKQSQFGRAEQLLVKLTRRYPVGKSADDWTVRARVQLASVRNRVNQPDLAIRAADEVLERYPHQREAVYQKARALEILALRAEGAQRADLKAQAAALLRNLPAQGGESDWRNTLTAFLLEGNSESAEALLKQVLEKNPADEAALQSLVTIYLQTDQRDAAAKAVAAAAQRNPDSRQIKQLQILTATDLNDAERDAHQRKLLEAIEDPFVRAVSLARYALQKEALEEGQRDLDTAESLRPDSAPVVHQQFLLAVRQFDWARAEKYVARCAELNVDGAGGRSFRGQLHLARAEQAARRHEREQATAELEQAVVQFTRALEVYPSNSMVQTWLGAAQRSLGNMGEAKAALAAALALNPNNGEAHLLSAQIAYAEGNRALGDRHLADARRMNPRDPRVRALVTAQEEQNNPTEAIKRREALRTEKPDDQANLVRLIKLYLLQGETDKALAGLEAARKLAPDDLSLVMQTAQLLGQSGAVAKGEQVFKDWIGGQDAAKAKARGQVALAMYCRGHADHYSEEQIAEAYRAAVGLAETAATCLEMAEWERARGRSEQAVGWYKQAIAHAADKAQERRIRERVTRALYQDQLIDAAAEQAKALRQAFPDDVDAAVLQAAIDLDRGQVDAALATVNQVLEKHPNDARAHYQRGVLYFRQSRLGPAIDSLQKAKSLRPDGFGYQHRVLLSRALELNRQLDLAIAELESIRRDHPEATNVIVALVELYLRHEQTNEARQLLVEYTSRYPESADWAYRRGRLARQLENRSEALRWLRKAAERSKFDPVVTDAYMAALLGFGAWDDLIRFATTALPEAKRNTGPVQRRLAVAYGRKGDKQAAIKAINQALSTLVTREGLQALATDLVAVYGARPAAALAEEQSKARGGDRRWAALQSAALAAGGDVPQSIRRFETLLSEAKDDNEKLVLQQWLASLLYRQKEYEKARAAYEAVLKRQPDDQVALNNLAYLLAEDLKRPGDALPYAKRSAALAGRNANTLDTLGFTQLLLDDVSGAITTLLQAIRFDAKLVAAHHHLGLAYEKRGDHTAAAREFELAVKLGEEQKETMFAPQAKEALRKLGRNP